MSSSDRSPLAAVGALHRQVDRAVAALLEALGDPLRCAPGCQGCCLDDLTVFEVEARWLLEGYPGGLVGEPASPGRCALLSDDGRCRVYERRPYVCRTQGLPLRWLDELEEGGQIVERRDICELNEDRVELLELGEDACWTLGPFEGRLATIQAGVDGGELRRVLLREVAQRLSRAGGVVKSPP